MHFYSSLLVLSGLVVSVENWHAAPAGPADIVTHYDYANVKRPI